MTYQNFSHNTHEQYLAVTRFSSDLRKFKNTSGVDASTVLRELCDCHEYNRDIYDHRAPLVASNLGSLMQSYRDVVHKSSLILPHLPQIDEAELAQHRYQMVFRGTFLTRVVLTPIKNSIKTALYKITMLSASNRRPEHVDFTAPSYPEDAWHFASGRSHYSAIVPNRDDGIILAIPTNSKELEASVPSDENPFTPLIPICSLIGKVVKVFRPKK